MTVTPSVAESIDLRTPSEAEYAEAVANSPLGVDFAEGGTPVTEYLGRELAIVWRDFIARLEQVPVVAKLESGQLTPADYRRILINLRQQVKEGARWISRTASSMEIQFVAVRTMLIGHAAEEQLDYRMLEDNFVAAGGNRADIERRGMNIGSEIFSTYMLSEASKTNPLHLFGSMFIIEGLGQAKADGWARAIMASCDLPEEAVTFLLYHGENDEEHYQKLRAALRFPLIDMELAERLVRTAKITGRLYCLQLEELDNL